MKDSVVQTVSISPFGQLCGQTKSHNKDGLVFGGKSFPLPRLARSVCLFRHPFRLPSFAFPEDEVQAAADQGGGEADPSQDEGGAVGALLEARLVEAVLLTGVDGGCDHHAQRCGQRVGRSSDLSYFCIFILIFYAFFRVIHMCHRMAALTRNGRNNQGDDRK